MQQSPIFTTDSLSANLIFHLNHSGIVTIHPIFIPHFMVINRRFNQRSQGIFTQVATLTWSWNSKYAVAT